MARCRRAVALLVAASCLGAAGGARAGGIEDGELGAPGPGLLVAGIVVGAGGGALTYLSLRRYADSDGSSTSALLLNTFGTLTMQAGGALSTTWAWRRGQHRYAYERAGNLPMVSRRPQALTGLVIGGVAVAAMYVGTGFIVAKEISCTHTDVTSAEILSCAKDRVLTVSIIDLVAGGVLLVAAPVAGYGLGYDTAARDAGHAFSLRLTPHLIPGGAGLTLGGRF